jgi:hypothetical protein
VQLPDPTSESFTSDIGVDTDLEGADSQEIATSAPSSQDTAGFKRPVLPQTVILQQENDRLRDQVNILIQEKSQAMFVRGFSNGFRRHAIS